MPGLLSSLLERLRSRAVQAALGLAIGGVFFWLSLRGTSLDEVTAALAGADRGWLALAALLYAADLALRAARWQALLRNCASLSYQAVGRCLVVGYGVNMMLPARLGELLRAEFMKRNYGVSRSTGLASVALERLLDGGIVVACLALGLWIGGAGGDNSALLTLCVSAAALFIALATGLASASWLARQSWLQAWKPLQSRAADVQAALAVVRTPAFIGAGLMTFAIYALETGVLAAIVASLGVAPTPALALIVLGAASLSTLLPSAPGFIGTYQFAFTLALAQFGYDEAIGVAAATLAQSLLFAPLSILAITLMIAASREPAKVRHVL